MESPLYTRPILPAEIETDIHETNSRRPVVSGQPVLHGWNLGQRSACASVFCGVILQGSWNGTPWGGSNNANQWWFWGISLFFDALFGFVNNDPMWNSAVILLMEEITHPFDMENIQWFTGFLHPRPQVVSRISSINSLEGAIVSQIAVDICWCIYRAVGWRGCSDYMNPSLENQEKGHFEIWSWSKDPYEPISVTVMQAVVCRIVLSRVKPYSAARIWMFPKIVGFTPQKHPF